MNEVLFERTLDIIIFKQHFLVLLLFGAGSYSVVKADMKPTMWARLVSNSTLQNHPLPQPAKC